MKRHHPCVFALAMVASLTPGAEATPADPPPAVEQLVLGAAHLPGLNQTQWRTNLEVCNFGTALNFRLDFLQRGQANVEPHSVPFIVPAGMCVRFADVVRTLFGLEEAAGAIRVTCDGDGCLAQARTFNDDPDGTYGAGQPALAAEAAITSRQTAALIHLAESADDGSGYRTNLELLNVTGAPLAVQVALFRANGDQLGTLTVDLLPFEDEQVTRVFRQVTTAAVSDGYALLHTMTPGGAFLAAASLVDNRSGDGTTIPATAFASALPQLEPITAANASRARALRVLRIPQFAVTTTSQCSVDFSPDGSLLSAVCDRNPAPVWDVATGHLTLSLLASPAHEVATTFRPDGAALATGGMSSRVAIWDAGSGELSEELRVSPAAVWELAFSPQGDKLALATVNYYGSSDPAYLPGMHLWDLARGERLWSYPADQQELALSVSYHPGADVIAFGTAFNGLHVLDAETGLPITHLAMEAPVGDLAFSPDGELLAAGCDDTRIHLWRTSDYQLVRTLEGHSHFVNGIAFSPDESLLASGSHDHTVGLWELATGQRLVTLEGHSQPVLRVAVNQPGTLIASVSWDGTVRLWGVPAQDVPPRLAAARPDFD